MKTNDLDLVLGFDIGGTTIAWGAVSKDGSTILRSYALTKEEKPLFEKYEIKTQAYETFDDFFKALVKKVDQFIEDNNLKGRIRGIGAGCPNGKHGDNTMEYAPNIRWAREYVIHLGDAFEQYYSLPVSVTNDADAAGMGEKIYGAAKNVRDFLLLTLGTGLGSVLFVNNDLVYGHDSFAGEIGHVRAEGNDRLGSRLCGCGRWNCTETFVSATGIKRTAFELMAKYNGEFNGKKSELSQYSFDRLDSEKIYQAAVRGDEIALECFRITGEILGIKLADSVAYTSPEKIYLFGGLTKAGDYILKPTREYFEKNLLKIWQGKGISIELSQLPDADAAVLGAGALIWNELDK